MDIERKWLPALKTQQDLSLGFIGSNTHLMQVEIQKTWGEVTRMEEHFD
jgi:hypothetical protein